MCFIGLTVIKTLGHNSVWFSSSLKYLIWLLWGFKESLLVIAFIFLCVKENGWQNSLSLLNGLATSMYSFKSWINLYWKLNLPKVLGVKVNGFGNLTLMTSLPFFFNLQEIQVFLWPKRCLLEEHFSSGNWLLCLFFSCTTFYFEKFKTRRKLESLD